MTDRPEFGERLVNVTTGEEMTVTSSPAGPACHRCGNMWDLVERPGSTVVCDYCARAELGLLAMLVVPGEPVPWRPKRVTQRGHRYVESRQRDHSMRFGAAAADAGLKPLPAPAVFRLEATFVTARPAYHYGTGRNRTVVKARYWPAAWPVTRPDLSNLVKLAEDGLTGHVWADDDQVVHIEARKRYVVSRAEEPRTIVAVYLIQQDGEGTDAG